MPDPKKKKNKAPANASTDTGTGAKKKTETPARASTDTGTGAYQRRPSSRAHNVTEKGAGVPQKRTYDKPYNVWATAGTDGSAGQTYAYIEDDSFADGGPGQYTPLVSGGQGGRVTSMPRRSRDPFLEGLNSDLDGIRERPTGRKRRK